MTPSQKQALELAATSSVVPTLVKEADGAWHARWRPADGTQNDWIDEAMRRATQTPLSRDAEHQTHPSLHDAWLLALRSRTGIVAWEDSQCAAFAATLEEWAAAALPDFEARAALVFRFSSHDGEFHIETNAPEGRAQYEALGRSIEFFSPLRGLCACGGGEAGPMLRVQLERGEAAAFLKGGARRLREAGYGVEGCEVAAQVSVALDIAAGEDSAKAAAPLPTRLVVRVAGREVTAEEIRFLLEQGSTLVFFRDRWIEVDRGILREALRALERAGGNALSRTEAVAFALGAGAIGRLQIDEVRAHGWLRGLVNELRQSGGLHLANGTPPGFAGTLRDYQRRGVAWLDFLVGNGFGALLADDMGLGKTIQTLAWASGLRNAAKSAPDDDPLHTKAPILIVAPISLLSNWRHEAARFTPSLAVYVHHGEKRHLASGFVRAASAADIVLTSYTLLVKDYAQISMLPWSAVVIDEAPIVKNPATRAARALRALGAPRRIALTGTPVENSVDDLWSLEEFLNPGFLPDRKTFTENFSKPLAADAAHGAAKRIRHALEPFILRRLKNDPAIAPELGEKREIREYCELTQRERAAYETALADYRASEHRRGDIFALITRLKLVCDGEGKLARLFDLLEAIFAAGESALVFTQYAKIGAMLAEALEKRFSRKFPFMHGALSTSEREKTIAAFNAPGPNAFILSLRTGGFGLNLIKATHVIHFDRWWNPAVEAQATDRAHRIGQTSTVFVHIFITSGTIEERVDAILEHKLAAAGSLVATGEAFLAKMSPEEFAETVQLDNAGA